MLGPVCSLLSEGGTSVAMLLFCMLLKRLCSQKCLSGAVKALCLCLGGVQEPVLGRELWVLHLMLVEVAKHSQNPTICPRPSSQAAFMHLRRALPGGRLQLSCFCCLLSMSLCGGNGLGG